MLSCVKLRLLGGMAVTALAVASHGFAWLAGKHEGAASAQANHHQQQMEQVNQSIRQIQQEAAQSHARSEQISRAIHYRLESDASATKEFIDALSRTSYQRVECLFDDDIMHFLRTAREQASAAAAHGLGTTLPAAD